MMELPGLLAILMLWGAPPAFLASVWIWICTSRRPGPAQRNAWAVGAAGASIAWIVLVAVALHHLSTDPIARWDAAMLPGVPALGLLFALLGGWAVAILWLAFRARLHGVVDPRTCPSLLASLLAALVLIALTAGYLHVVPLLLARS